MNSKVVTTMTAWLLALATVTSTAPSLAAVRIDTGNWVADCVERFEDGTTNVACDRYGGYDAFPAGCNPSAMFVCLNMTLCDLARNISVVDGTDNQKLQREVYDCGGEVRGPAVQY